MSSLFEDISSSKITESGKFGWQSPSNIAIVKYWGKYGNQLPSNANLSFTLSTAVSRTTIGYGPSRSGSMEVSFRLSGERQEKFEERIERYLTGITQYLPFLSGLSLIIDSENSFPHSSGIASSASGMSALALCLCSMAEKLEENPWDKDLFLMRASFLARLGSGSAARSVFPKAAEWGKLDGYDYSTEYATKISDIHPDFLDYRDSILLIHEGVKEVSSSVGHSLMNNSPYADNRFESADKNTERLLSILKDGDLNAFVELCEREALTLHGLMMLSKPPYILMQPNTISAIRKVQAFRKDTGIPICFTLDAGPNLHVLYPNAYYEDVKPFVEAELAPLCQGGKWLDDQMGDGPEAINIL